MGIQSQEGYLLVVTQEDPDTYSDPGDPARPGWKVPVRSGSITTNRDLLVPDPEIGGNRDIDGAVLGPVSFTGEFDMYARPRLMYPFVKSAAMGWTQDGVDLGTIGSSGASVGTGTVLTPGFLSIEQQIGAVGHFPTEKYYNVACNTWTLTADAAGVAEFTVGLVGQYMQGTGNPTTLGSLYEDGTAPITTSGKQDPALGGFVSVAYAPYASGVPTTLYPKSVSFTVNNNIEDDDFRLGSLYLGDVTPKRREVGGSLTVRPDDASMWKQAVWGDPVATSPGGMPTSGKLVICLAGEPIPGTGYSQMLTIESEVILHPFTVDPSADDIIEHGIDFTSVFPNGNTVPSTVMAFLFATISAGDPQFR